MSERRTIVWDVMICDVGVHRRFGDTLPGLVFDTEAGGSTLLRYICKLLPDYTASYPRK
jgi:hypothetical protein